MEKNIQQYGNAFENARMLLNEYVDFFDIFPRYLLMIVESEYPNFYECMKDYKYELLLIHHHKLIKKIVDMYVEYLIIFKEKVKWICKSLNIIYYLDLLLYIMDNLTLVRNIHFLENEELNLEDVKEYLDLFKG